MKKFTVITKDGSKWLRARIPHDFLDSVEFVEFPYMGSHPEGTTLDESEVTAITQARHKDYTGSDWFNVYDNGNWDYYQTRIAYTDVEPECPEEDIYDAVADYRKNHPEPSHDRHIRPFKTHNVRPLVNQLVGEEISFSRFIELLNGIANTH